MKTIKDVARKAGVGIATVSRFLNKKGYVSNKSANKIESAMSELNYYPNAAAQSIKSKKSYTIALVIPTISNAFFPELANSIETNLSDLGYKMILCNTNESIEKEERYVDVILQNRIDGVITATGYLSNRLIESDLPIVLLDRIDDNPNDFIVTVTSNHYQGGVQATNCLIENGCKKLLHLHGSLSNEPATLRKKAFEDVCLEKDMEFTSLCVDSGYDVNEIVKKYDGVFIWTDIDSIRFISTCLERNIKIPDDIQIVGFDNIQLSKQVYPKVTTIAQPIDELCNKVSEILLKMIDTKETIKENVILDTELVVRDTTKG
ncbi:LacI family DNA-binding transcriptional regulator [Mycoplasmatota bacterium]|nr:LacI family DNA-binding transcriptional regulator [Mycoplasmatota bacterium]